MVNYKLSLTDIEFDQCKKFAIESAKSQREYRSGGTQIRSEYMIAEDTQRGKVAEVLTKKFLEQFGIKSIELDFNIYPRGAWDDQDFVLNGKKVSIKSAKWFSNWLLLETKDLNRGDTYDYYIFVTVDKDLKSGTIKGFASNNDILKDPKTISLEKGDCIPNTSTKLDAANYARHSNDLKNSIEEWNNLITILNNN